MAACMNILFKLLKYKGHHAAQFPYNLNWGIRRLNPLNGFLSENPIILADIGARGGIPGELNDLKPAISCYSFDADVQECERLKKNPPEGLKSYSVFPYFVGSEDGIVDFNLYHHGGASSMLKPDPRFRKYFAGPDFHIENTIKVKSYTLDQIIEKEKVPFPDMLKLDTQGTELDILRSSPNAVSNASLVEVEVEFVSIYEKQHLFHDVSKFMHEKGFDLLYLNRTFGHRTVYHTASRGQLIFGDALFGKREDLLAGTDINIIAKYAVMLINYGHLDFAYQLCLLYPEIKKAIPAIDQYFKVVKYRKLRSIAKFFIFQLDKLIFLLLHLRKTNFDNQDCDRNWPCR